MTQEALKLALDYLESRGLAWNVQIALREALREHAMREVQRLGQEIEQEPVKYSDYEPDGVHHNKPPQQEPVAWLSTDSIGERHLCFDKPLDNDPVQLLFTTPPQRTWERPWVSLTDEDVNGFVGQYWGDEYMKMRSMVRAIEAKLKEKNT